MPIDDYIYSPEKQGDLWEYLRTHDGASTSNAFRGPKYFFVMKGINLLVPSWSCMRVFQSPAPDITYVINDKFLLESSGRGNYNMSAMGAEKGVYSPERVLKNKVWSVFNLNIEKLFSEEQDR